ncbi:MAG: FecR family protein [Tenacibaculum sp.]
MKSKIDKYLRGDTNEFEEKQLYNWLLKDDTNIEIFKEKIAYYMLDNTENKPEDTQKAFEEFKENVKRLEVKQVSVFSYKKYYKYIAAVAILFSSIYLAYIVLGKKDKSIDNIFSYTKSNNNVDNQADNQIILTLHDGTKQIVKQVDEISYINISSKEPLAYNQIEVPKGKTFKIVLADSTIVWLNADSKLKYPKKFDSALKSRTVKLEGEAFFEVKHNKNKPFIVSSHAVNIKVLGTKFNVSSYANDKFISTTLVEGLVNVIDKNNANNSTIVQPGFQTSFQKANTRFKTKKVNPLHYTCWIQKKIIFNDISFENLIVKLERAYNVEIINENEQIKKEHFTGQFDIENIETIFKALSSNYYFKYQINNNKIIIKK